MSQEDTPVLVWGVQGYKPLPSENPAGDRLVVLCAVGDCDRCIILIISLTARVPTAYSLSTFSTVGVREWPDSLETWPGSIWGPWGSETPSNPQMADGRSGGSWESAAARFGFVAAVRFSVGFANPRTGLPKRRGEIEASAVLLGIVRGLEHVCLRAIAR
ncbi:hypothetical protein FZEAL_2671 [Fusarium zealandicum]|uniref:Uncharacterized protein n=1 Tax=Fusarium zealandicum TaxID=1053134 RepID=A0A8H4UQD8_9HYPO|nr:hypothetical protein FZEAL_2671 [Fusarium zealandicum]